MILWSNDEDAHLRRWHADENGCAHTYQWMADKLNAACHGGRPVRTAAAVSRRNGYVNFGRPGKPAVDAPAGRPAVDSRGADALRMLLSDAVHALDVLTGALRSVKERGHIPAPVFHGMENMSKAVVLRLRKTREGL